MPSPRWHNTPSDREGSRPDGCEEERPTRLQPAHVPEDSWRGRGGGRSARAGLDRRGAERQGDRPGRGADSAQCQRQDPPSRGRAAGDPARRTENAAEYHRAKARLRPRIVRRVHGHPRRPHRLFLLDAGDRSAGQGHPHRGGSHRGHRAPLGAAGVLRPRRSDVRLLHAGVRDRRRGTARKEPKAVTDRKRGRRSTAISAAAAPIRACSRLRSIRNPPRE